MTPKGKLQELPSPYQRGKTGWPWTEESPALPAAMPDGSLWPKISIVTPSFNQGQFIEETIRSVLLQGYPNLEYIIIDGGSNDKSVEIIKKYAPWLTFWVSEKDRGQSHAINKGFTRVTGQLMNWLNSDDYLLPGALRNLGLATIERAEDKIVLAANGLRCTEGALPVETLVRQYSGLDAYPSYPVYGGVQASWFFTREALESTGPLREDLNFCMDVDLYSRMHWAGVEFVAVNELVAAFRVHMGGKTSANVLRAIIERQRLFKEYIEAAKREKADVKFLSRFYRKQISGMYLTACQCTESKLQRYGLWIKAAVIWPGRLYQRYYWGIILFPATKKP